MYERRQEPEQRDTHRMKQRTQNKQIKQNKTHTCPIPIATRKTRASPRRVKGGGGPSSSPPPTPFSLAPPPPLPLHSPKGHSPCRAGGRPILLLLRPCGCNNSAAVPGSACTLVSSVGLLVLLLALWLLLPVADRGVGSHPVCAGRHMLGFGRWHHESDRLTVGTYRLTITTTHRHTHAHTSHVPYPPPRPSSSRCKYTPSMRLARTGLNGGVGTAAVK